MAGAGLRHKSIFYTCRPYKVACFPFIRACGRSKIVHKNLVLFKTAEFQNRDITFEFSQWQMPERRGFTFFIKARLYNRVTYHIKFYCRIFDSQFDATRRLSLSTERTESDALKVGVNPAA